jgi:hypothetical protein
MAIGYGSGLALIVDEFALLLDPKDVYWSSMGGYRSTSARADSRDGHLLRRAARLRRPA